MVARTSTANDGLGVFLVPRDVQGVTVTRTWMVDSRNAATVQLADVRVEDKWRLGSGEDATEGLESVLDLGRIAMAAEMLGGATSFRTHDELPQDARTIWGVDWFVSGTQTPRGIDV